MTFTLDASQQLAVQLMTQARFGLVTGPPGSGKTTTLNAALDALGRDPSRVALAAPTGKAARRMAQVTGMEARTLHRLLGWTPDGWTYDRHNPLPFDRVLVDESSMIDYALALAFFDGAAHSHVILIGDADQLPPVGPGRMFGDLVDRAADVGVPLARLRTQHRAAAESWVARNAPRVLTGGPIETESCAGFDWLRVDAAADIPDAVRDAMLAWSHKNPDADPPQVLAPSYRGACGCDALNAALDPLLNAVSMRPRQDEPVLTRGDDKVPIRAGMRVIQTANNYELGVMNGEIGVVENIDGARGPVDVCFPELSNTVITYPRGDASALQPAYALTVHKTQGSEFKHVWVVCHSAHSIMLTRSLLYTAITRARTHVTLIGDERGLGRALRNDAARRETTLIERLAESIDPVVADV